MIVTVDGETHTKRPLASTERDALLKHGDHYMHLADLASYAATQARVSDLYADRVGWGRKAILNVGCSGKFSSDRTIAEYAGSIWGATPCPVGESGSPGMAACP